ncbi:hypothetical protein FE257_009731 [Aspergillus nanangensis]|uniref:Uncharacterized protein n=1 Tax=Aspergillus nanangensis TaxID=2582783 RepID=A0AAD4GTP5_ASPNN|nr:hypothetical protein FE257_009731 [Aspergillus nanangensis]
MNFYAVVLLGFLGLAAASAGHNEKRVPTNNCYTLCKIDGGSDKECLNKCKNQ